MKYNKHKPQWCKIRINKNSSKSEVLEEYKELRLKYLELTKRMKQIHEISNTLLFDKSIGKIDNIRLNKIVAGRKDE